VPASAADLQTSECNCTTATCGAGMANAHNAVLQALRPIAAVSAPAAYAAGSSVTLDGAGSAAACNATLSAYQWTVVQPSSNPPVIQNANGAQASVTAPLAPGTSYTLMLTVTDNSGRSDSAQVVVGSAAARSTAPASAGNRACLAAVSYQVAAPSSSGASAGAGGGGGGGGGGAIDPVTLLACALAALPLALRYRSRCAASSHGRCARR
jgi:serine protease